MPTTTAQISPAEYAAFYVPYVANVPTDQPLAEALRDSQRRLDAWLDAQSPDRAGYRYAPGKWTVAQCVQHLLDAERVFAYRLLRIARGDATPLPGFDQDAYAEAAGERLGLPRLRAELGLVRRSTVALVDGLGDDALARTGTASGKPVSARAIAAITAGHTLHHLRVFEERYG